MIERRASRSSAASRLLWVLAGSGLVIASVLLAWSRRMEDGARVAPAPPPQATRGGSSAHDARADASGEVETTAVDRSVAAAPAADVELAGDTTGAIEGRVVLEDGNGAAGVILTVREGMRRAATERDGRFRIGAVPDGLHDVLVAGGGIRTTIVPRVRVRGGPVALEIVVEPGASVPGVVVDDVGGPAASFPLVLVVPSPLEGVSALASFERRPFEREVVSDEHGAFLLEGLGESTWRLEARGEGFVPASWLVNAGSPPLEIIVHRIDRSLEGRVVDARSGDGVGDAPVRLLVDELPRSWHWTGQLERSARTDREGRFRIVVPREGYASIEVDHRPYRRAIVEGLRLAADRDERETVLVELEQAGALRGKITGEDGAGVGGVEVSILSRLFDESTVDGAWATPVVSGETGEFALVLDRLDHAGTYAVSFRHDAFLDRRLWMRIDDAAATTEIGTVVLERGAVLVGTVTNGEGAPLEGATVAVSWEENPDRDLELDATRWGRRECKTDAGGRYRLEGILEGACALSVWLGGYYDPVDDRELELATDDPEQAEHRVDLQLFPTEAIAGSCVDLAGAPVAGAVLRATSVERASGYAWPEKTATDAAGGFRLDGLRPGTYSLDGTWSARVGGQELLSGALEDVTTGTEGLVLVLEPSEPRVALAIEVRAAESGNAVTRFSAWLLDAEAARAGLRSARREDRFGNYYRSDDVPPGRYRLVVTAEGRVPHDVWIDLVGVLGEPLPIALSRGRTLRGVVLDPDGRPVPKASLVAYRAEPGWTAPTSDDPIGEKEDTFHYRQGARTDSAGTFTIAGLIAEPYRLRVVAGGFTPATLGPLTPVDGVGEAITVELAPIAAE